MNLLVTSFVVLQEPMFGGLGYCLRAAELQDYSSSGKKKINAGNTANSKSTTGAYGLLILTPDKQITLCLTQKLSRGTTLITLGYADILTHTP